MKKNYKSIQDNQKDIRLLSEISNIVEDVEKRYLANEDKDKQNKQNYKKSKLQQLVNVIKRLIMNALTLLSKTPKTEKEKISIRQKIKEIMLQIFITLKLISNETQKINEKNRDKEREKEQKKLKEKEKTLSLLLQNQRQR